jgi:hypothetical protein
MGLLGANGLDRVRPLRIDRSRIARILSHEEEKALRSALKQREALRRQRRLTANQWRVERGYAEYPAKSTYTDHLAPLVLLALLTGMRRGELFHLNWDDVDLVAAKIVVRGAHAKSGQSRVVPLCREARILLEAMESREGQLVFPGKAKSALVTVKTGWSALLKTAGIRSFRFHDLRHTFASRLLEAGASAAVVRDILGHQSVAITDRYVHASAQMLRATEGIDTTTPAGRLQMHLLAAIAEFERARLGERVKAGLARVRAQGKTLGRPRTEVPTQRVLDVADLTLDHAAARLGVSRSTLKRWRKEVQKTSSQAA